MHIRSEIDMPGILFKFALGQQYITPVHPKSIIIIFTECTTFKRYDPPSPSPTTEPLKSTPLNCTEVLKSL